MANNEPQFELANAILCDDARREDNGKDILIGVYSGHIVVKSFPTNLLVCLWLQCKTKGTGEVEREIRALDVGGKEIMLGQFGASIVDSEEGYASFSLTKIRLDIQKEGRIKFQWKKKGGRWRTVLIKEIKLAPPNKAIS